MEVVVVIGRAEVESKRETQEKRTGTSSIHVYISRSKGKVRTTRLSSINYAREQYEWLIQSTSMKSWDYEDRSEPDLCRIEVWSMTSVYTYCQWNIYRRADVQISTKRMW